MMSNIVDRPQKERPKCPCIRDFSEQDCGFPDCYGGWEEVYKDAMNEITRLREELENYHKYEEDFLRWRKYKTSHPQIENIIDQSIALDNDNKRLREEVERLNTMSSRVVNMCRKRGWSMHWTHRGAYLHLESSELIEAIRGKHGDPLSEAGDVLLVLMSITEYAGFPFNAVVDAANKKLEWLEESPPYEGEEREALQEPK